MLNTAIQKLPIISESLHNYPITDNIRISEDNIISNSRDNRSYPDNEEVFWDEINHGIKKRNYCWGQTFVFYTVMVSEWIPRMPGVFWTEKSEALRRLAQNEIASRSERHVTYTPIGKSSKVLGGLGTFKCAPQNGFRMVCLTMSGNCSAGIPAKISEEDWQRLNLEEGAILHNLEAEWVKMETNWSTKFTSSINLVRGCLVLKNTNQIDVDSNSGNPVAHPYTILEYYKNGAPYYDFMYFTIDKKSIYTDYEQFLNTYKTQENRNGRYIFEPDPNEIIYGADYISPSNYLEKGNEDINIIKARIEEILKDESSGILESIYNFLMTNISNENELVILSKQDVINIPPIQWRGGMTLSKTVRKFLDLVINQKKTTSLYDLLQTEHPKTFLSLN